jgi:hypothetical protein
MGSLSNDEPMCCYPLMCIQEGSDMGGRVRGLGTSEFWFSPVYRAILFFGLDRGQYMLVYCFWSALCWCCIVVSFFNKDVYDFSF